MLGLFESCLCVGEFFGKLASFAHDFGADLGGLEIGKNLSCFGNPGPIFGGRGMKELLDDIQLAIDYFCDAAAIACQPRVDARKTRQRGIVGRVHGGNALR